jgi:transposase InsO family protein
MSWKEWSAMDEKKSFIIEWEAGEYSFTALCKAFGISRELGYRTVRRYLKKGERGLEQDSRAPLNVWNRTAEELEKQIIAIRKGKPRYGPLKIRTLLTEKIDEENVPSASTIGLILTRHGLVKKRRMVRRIREVHPIFNPQYANQIWTADFKGEFRMGNMRYCYPLTVADGKTKYLLGIEGMHHPAYQRTKAVFYGLFRKYGLPDQIHTDNGEPFASPVSLSRLTHLSVWFIELGIMPVYSDPGHPEQNGSHERMHRELKEEATRPPAKSLGWQQRKFDAFRKDYNEVRPHQTLGQRRPAEFYTPSPRRLPRKKKPWKYPEGMVVKYVCRNGAIRWGAHKWITISTTLIEKYIGLEEFAAGKWRVYFRNVLLGYLDEKILRIQDDQGRLRRNA